jgi:hypothetical protein
MKAPAPACFKDWQEHDVLAHEEWVKTVGRFHAAVLRFASTWGYVITETVGASDHVIDGNFDWDWTAMDACDRCEKALSKLTT